jgi:hypothetical protein
MGQLVVKTEHCSRLTVRVIDTLLARLPRYFVVGSRFCFPTNHLKGEINYGRTDLVVGGI